MYVPDGLKPLCFENPTEIELVKVWEVELVKVWEVELVNFLHLLNKSYAEQDSPAELKSAGEQC